MWIYDKTGNLSKCIYNVQIINNFSNYWQYNIFTIQTYLQNNIYVQVNIITYIPLYVLVFVTDYVRLCIQTIFRKQ